MGAGPCGEALTGELKGAGLSLAVVESHLVGGECPYYGCMPSKTLIRSAETLAEAARARELAASAVDVNVDFGKAAARTAWMTNDWKDAGAAAALEKAGARLVRARGRVAGERRVELESGDVLTARKAVVVASGTRPAVPPIPGLDRVEHWTNREAVAAKTLPASMIVIGGGAVGVELAQAFARFGCAVTIVEGGPRVVAPEEPEAGEVLGQALVSEGIKVVTGAAVTGVEGAGKGVRVLLKDGARLEAERLLLATGRHPNTDGFDVAGAGASLSQRGFLNVDPKTLLAAEGLYGGGDVNGIYGFTHVSHYHGVLIGRALRGRPRPAEHDAIPRVTFTDPEIGSVGLSEGRARGVGIEVRAARAEVPTSGRGYIHDAKFGFVKLVADSKARVLVGATVVSPRAGEVIGELALAVRARVPLDVLDDTIQGFPTFSRILQGTFAELIS